MESVYVLYGVDIIGGGALKYNLGHCQRGGALKKHKDMRGGLEKNTSTKEGVPRKNAKW